jgi:peptidoglycan hydrolase-like protein with peptidoglycan-binding domain
MSYYETEGLGESIVDRLFGTGQTSLSKTVTPSASPTMVQAKAASAVAAVVGASSAQRRAPIPAVLAFQQVYGNNLAVDGVYGQNTRAALAAVTGRQNLPAVETSSVPSPSDLIPALPEALPEESAPASSWIVPVAVVGTVVSVAGYLFFRKRPMKPNRKARLRGYFK